MFSFYKKNRLILWGIILVIFAFDLGMLVSNISAKNMKTKVYSLKDKAEDEQVLLFKIALSLREMTDNGFFCHLGGINEENMKSEFCKALEKNRHDAARFSLQLSQQLIDKKCRSHSFFVGMMNFASALDMIAKKESDEDFQFTNTSLRDALIQQSKEFETMNVKLICSWN